MAMTLEEIKMVLNGELEYRTKRVEEINEILKNILASDIPSSYADRIERFIEHTSVIEIINLVKSKVNSFNDDGKTTINEYLKGELTELMLRLTYNVTNTTTAVDKLYMVNKIKALNMLMYGTARILD